MAKFDVLVVRRTKYGTAHTAHVKPYSKALQGDVERCESLDKQLGEILIESLAKPKQFQRTAAEELRRRVYELQDAELVLYLRDTSKETFNDWEKGFADGVLRFFETHRSLSWKQRKYARQIVERLEEQALAKADTI